MSPPGALLARSAEQGSRSVLLPQFLLAALCGGYAVGASLGWGSPATALFMGDFGLAAGALAAAVSCLLYARTVSGPSRPAWLLFALSSAMLALGNGVWGWYEVVLDEPVPGTSPADWAFLCFGPSAIAGLLLLAKRPVTRAGWVCLLLDTWLVAGSLLTLCWSLALSHTADRTGEGPLRQALALSYPLLDIALVSAVLALTFRRSSVNRAAVNTAVAALGLTVLCDALFTSPALRESYRSGQILDAGWFAASLLLAYAPWAGRRAQTASGGRPARRPARPAARPFTALVPYLAAAVCVLSILHASLTGRPVDAVVLSTGCAVVLALVVRQAIMLLENIALTNELARKENHFRSLVQGSSDVIMMASPSGTLRYVSPASRGVYGRPAEELIGTDLAAHIHPEDRGGVLHEVRRFLAAPPETEPATRIECRFRDGSGGWLHIESTVNRYRSGLIFNSRDVTERVRLQAQLQHNASHDPLTDLPNRSLFTERVGRALDGRRGGDGCVAVLFIDLDGFKAVNDTVGHQAGDELLVHAARRLTESVRAEDTVARLGGDEFAALVRGVAGDRATRERQVREVADRLRTALSRPYRVFGTEVRVAASIGIAFAEPGLAPGDLMRNADLAMYRAKSAGKGRVETYAPHMQAEAVRRAELADRLRTALHAGEFTLLHQPVVDLATGQVHSVEAQARWRSSRGILFTPAEFLQAAEDTDRTAELSQWVLEKAVEHTARRHRAGCPVPVAVRMSPRRLMERRPPERTLEALLARHRLPPGALVLYLAGTGPRPDPEDLQRRLTALRRLGVRIALDGFGDGHATMSALRSLPVDVLRLDSGLVAEAAESVRARTIVAGMLRIAADLGLQTVAEGVDLPEQALALRAMGCTHGQGMVFSGPLDEHRLRSSLTRGAYPLPRDPLAAGRTAPAAPLPVGPGGGAEPEPLPGPSARPNSETSVPPT
ncbi:putative bifunctional diguanylate cyclase/phosphodiesterase [Streptomyces thermolineatus]|uniref:putative bifunctional diguanylate cyclase/phosphodiesterase n=1 Tax=Streptomyces thermolineatus TaxID=44033 RepID=UPI00384A6CD0